MWIFWLFLSFLRLTLTFSMLLSVGLRSLSLNISIIIFNIAYALVERLFFLVSIARITLVMMSVRKSTGNFCLSSILSRRGKIISIIFNAQILTVLTASITAPPVNGKAPLAKIVFIT